MMKYYLLKKNQYLESMNNIFPNMIKNVYGELIRFDGFENLETFKTKIVRYVDNGFVDNKKQLYFDINSDCTLVLEFMSGDFVYFSSGSNGSSLGKCVEKYIIVESASDIKE